MNRLPRELAQTIYQFLPQSPSQLLNVTSLNKKFKSLLDTDRNWYNVFVSTYPNWSSCVKYDAGHHAMFNWKDIMLTIYKQTTRFASLSLQHIHLDMLLGISHHSSTHFARNIPREVQKPDSYSDSLPSDEPVLSENITSTRLHNGFKITGNLVSDIGPLAKNGITGLAFTRRHTGNDSGESYESTVLLWEYPSWKVIHSFTVDFLCQLTSIQTIHVPTTQENCPAKITFFSLAVGISSGKELLSHAILVYRLLDDHTSQLIARAELGGLVSSPDVFLFSQASWRNAHDKECHSRATESVADWIRMLSPVDATFDPNLTVFAAVFGRRTGSRGFMSHLFKLELKFECVPNHLPSAKRTAFWTTSIPCGRNEAHHIQFPAHLNHLVVSRKGTDGGLLLYDWRFGIKVGILRSNQTKKIIRHLSAVNELCEKPEHEDSSSKDGTNHENTIEIDSNILEAYQTATVIPSDALNCISSPDSIAKLGLRLASFGSDSYSNQRIQLWDISYLMDIPSDILHDNHCIDNIAMSEVEEVTNVERNSVLLKKMIARFPWWQRGSRRLKFLASTSNIKGKDLPYSPPARYPTMLLEHCFKKENHDKNILVTKFSTFSGSIAMLLNTEELLIIDVETGKTLRRIDLTTLDEDIVGANMSVINASEIIVTSENSLFQGVLK